MDVEPSCDAWIRLPAFQTMSSSASCRPSRYVPSSTFRTFAEVRVALLACFHWPVKKSLPTYRSFSMAILASGCVLSPFKDDAALKQAVLGDFRKELLERNNRLLQ